jgi:hypothetical protein
LVSHFDDKEQPVRRIDDSLIKPFHGPVATYRELRQKPPFIFFAPFPQDIHEGIIPRAVRGQQEQLILDALERAGLGILTEWGCLQFPDSRQYGLLPHGRLLRTHIRRHF